jgi:hypothetical protein
MSGYLNVSGTEYFRKPESVRKPPPAAAQLCICSCAGSATLWCACIAASVVLNRDDFSLVVKFWLLQYGDSSGLHNYLGIKRLMAGRRDQLAIARGRLLGLCQRC